MSIHAFELASFTEEIFRGSNKSQIECFDVCGNHVFVGGSDGYVRHFLIKTEQLANGTSVVQTIKSKDYIFERQISNSKSRIQRVMAIHTKSIQAVLVLCDGRLSLLHWHTLVDYECKYLKNFSNVRTFCRDSLVTLSSVHTCEIVIATTKKGIACIELALDAGQPNVAPGMFAPREDMFKGYEVDAMCRDGSTLCMALVHVSRSAKYVLYDITKHLLSDVVDYDITYTKPLIARVGQGEFLLTTHMDPHTLGVFANAKGSSSRAPIQFVEQPTQIAFASPYIISYCQMPQLIAVHSILDQMQKQVLDFKDFRAICESDKGVYLASSQSMALLVAVSFESQITQLLDARRVNEAIQLATVAYHRAPDTETLEQKKKNLAAVYRSAGLIHMSCGVFMEGADCLFRSGVDPRIVISLYPGLQLKPLPVQLDEAALKTQQSLKALDGAKLTSAYNALISYLSRFRNHAQIGELIDTALVAALSLVSAARLVEMAQSPNRCNVADVAAVLRQQGCFHAYALLLFNSRRHREALEVWKSLELGETKDATYPGLAYVITATGKLNDPQLVLAHAADWILSRSSEAVSLFMPTRRGMENRFNPDDVVNVLRSYPEATEQYLEYLVNDLKNDEERFHTRLAQSLLDRLSRNRSDGALEQRLLLHLSQSSRYDVQTLLRRVADTDMWLECAVLYGKLGEHGKALDIFIHVLKNMEAAEEYCIENTKGKDRIQRQALFQSLLEVYLSHGNDPAFRRRAIDLLNSHPADLDTAKVLQILPESWVLSVVAPYLRRSLTNSIHVKHIARIERGLARSNQVNVYMDYVRLTSKAFVISETSLCDICAQPLVEGGRYGHYPDGRLMHERCMREAEAKEL